VVLAAGRGSRLGQRTIAIPKALLPIGPRARDDDTETTFLRRQCEILRGFGVQRIVIAVGYHKEQIADAVNTWPAALVGQGDQAIKLVDNTAPDIMASGSLHSFQFCVRAGHGVLDGTRQTLLMDADIVYDRRALGLLLEAQEHSALLVCTAYRAGNEEVLVYGRAEAPRFLGKGLSFELVMGQPCLGEATGIVKLAPSDHALARATMDWMLGDPDAPEGSLERRGFGPARQNTEHEELTGRMMTYGRMRAVTFGDELPFMECDSEEEYSELRGRFYPALLDSEARGASA
jgi:choline kinase